MPETSPSAHDLAPPEADRTLGLSPRQWAFALAGGLAVVAGGTVLAGLLTKAELFDGAIPKKPLRILWPALVLGWAAVVAGFVLVRDWVERTGAARQERDRAIEERVLVAEERLLGAPSPIAATWDLGRMRLERYMDRNLEQVRWIFFVSVAVMVVGFGLILFGVLLAFASQKAGDDGQQFVAVVGAGSGVLIEFIGASLLKVYRSTMEQARTYMQVLERINAVGMSVQILEGIQEDPGLRNEGMAEVARRLLTMYDGSTPDAAPSASSMGEPMPAPPITIG